MSQVAIQFKTELQAYADTTQVSYTEDAAYNQAADDLSFAEFQFREYKAAHFIDPYIKPVLEFMYMQECKGVRIPIPNCSAYYRQTLYILKKNPTLMSHFENIKTAYQNYDFERKRFETFINLTNQDQIREINGIVDRFRPEIPPLQLNRLLKQFVLQNDIEMDVPEIPILIHLEQKRASEKQECPVCYTDFNHQKQVALNCNHSFCIDCIESYLKLHTEKDCINCPMCRTEIETMRTHTKTNVDRISNTACENRIFQENDV